MSEVSDEKVAQTTEVIADISELERNDDCLELTDNTQLNLNIGDGKMAHSTEVITDTIQVVSFDSSVLTNTEMAQDDASLLNKSANDVYSLQRQWAMEVLDARCPIVRMFDFNAAVKTWEDIKRKFQKGGIAWSRIICSLVFESRWPSLAKLESSGDIVFNVGLHPHEASEPVSEVIFNRMVAMARHPKCVGIGEVGLDFHTHWSSVERQNQEVFLARALSLAVELDKLVIIQKNLPAQHPVYLHCFSGTLDQAERWHKVFPRTGQRYCQQSGSQRDAPYLIKHTWGLEPVVTTIALAKNMAPLMVCEQTSNNATTFFGE